MTRKRKLPEGMAYCSQGNHIAPIGEFYIREGGKLSSWCKDCTAQGAKRSKDLKHMVGLLVKKITVPPEEEGTDIEKQTIIHSHLYTERNVGEPLAFPPAKLDWLTPLWGFTERIKGGLEE